MNNFDNFFSSPIYKIEKPEWVEEVYNFSLDYLNEAKELKKDIIKPGLVYHSKSLIYDKNLHFFHSFVEQESCSILDHQGFDMSKYNCKLKESWIQQFSKYNGYHEQHVHPNSHISGFFFIHSGKNTSYPIFQDPRPGALMNKLEFKKEEIITHGTENVKIQTKPGDFLFFNSYLPHRFMIDPGIEPYTFIHFNVEVKCS
jgi:uncharacterized protein (TIGR02466 family)